MRDDILIITNFSLSPLCRLITTRSAELARYVTRIPAGFISPCSTIFIQFFKIILPNFQFSHCFDVVVV